MFAAVGMFFTACTEECNHEFIEYDHSKDLVGTWTCLTDDFAEALVISADGSVVSTRLFSNEYREDIKGKIVLENGNVTMTFEDGGNFKSHFDIIPGMAFSIFNEEGERLTFNYCKEDLAEEIIGMWVCNDSKVEAKNDMLLQTFNEGGTTVMTGYLPEGENAEYVLNEEGDYKVVGDLVFIGISTNKDGDNNPFYVAKRLIYTPDATANGDIMTFRFYLPMGNDIVEASESFLRIRQTLDLAGMKYDYIKTFVTNVKGEDKDFPFMNTSFNFAKMDGSIIDKFLNATLFAVEFPDANTLKYNFLLGGEISPMTAPIEVEDNKMTIKMSVTNPAYQDVVVYAFQDQDNTQMHLYMPTSSFEKFFANASVHMMLSNGQLDANDTEAIEGVYKTIADAVESINLSLVMSKTK